MKGNKTDLEYNSRLKEIVSTSFRIFLFILFAFFMYESYILLDRIHETKSDIQQQIKYYESLESEMYHESF